MSRPSIPDEKLDELWAYLSGIADNHGVATIAIGGISNHVHLLIAIPQTMSVASAVNVLKANSSRWMHEHAKDFEWQKGYGAFSVSPSQVEPVKKYIRTQAEHHAKHTFEEEFVSLLGKCGVPYDPKHVFG
ncbi:MAG: IS200/IS605 family transposase [Terriglobales bacterium]